MPDFEIFTKRMVPLSKQPFVTINKRGTFSFNKAAYQAMQSPETVELLFDKSARIIGVRKVSSSEGHAYRVTGHSRPNGPFLVNATAFCHYYDIDTATSRRWTPTFDNDTLMIDLNGKAINITPAVAAPAGSEAPKS